MSTTSNRPDFASAIAALGIDPTGLLADSKGTLVPTSTVRAKRLQSAREGPPTLTDSLPVLTHAEGRGTRHLDLGEPLGEGGMGIVRDAVQVPLDRHVAVKSVRPERVDEDTTLSLLREA